MQMADMGDDELREAENFDESDDEDDEDDELEDEAGGAADDIRSVKPKRGENDDLSPLGGRGGVCMCMRVCVWCVGA